MISNDPRAPYPEFPAVWTSSMLEAFKACPTKFFFQEIEHWRPAQPSIHLHAGAAFAAGIEAARRAYYVEGHSTPDSVALGLEALIRAYGDFECPPDSAKSLERMAGALEFYFANYPLDNPDVGKPRQLGESRAIEFSFLQPLYVIHPATGEPLLFSGRADAILDAYDGTYIVDEKTTSQLGASWSRQWDLRGQFTGYCWAASEIGLPVTGVIVRGVSILKTKYETQQAISYRASWEVQRWVEETHHWISLAIEYWRAGFWPHNLGESCSSYGGCGFRQVCKSPNPDEWLPMYFERRRYDPITRTETPL